MTFDRSRELFARAQMLVAGGVSSQIRRSERPVPLFFERASGSRMWDVDGNEYVDYVMGMGPNLFGHAPTFILEAVCREMTRGIVFTGQFEKELAVSEMVREAVPLKGPVRYAGSGTEIVQLALRLARAFTGRSKFVKFEGHYHGWMDSVLFSVHPSLDEVGPEEAPRAAKASMGMSEEVAQNVIVAPWNKPEGLAEIFRRRGDEIACVIMEPILANTNCIMPLPGYLEAVKELCENYGSLLIFDEVITGFRVAPGGAQEVTGVLPDLATYAKAMAGGFPIAMLVGRGDVMALLGDGTVFHGGSFNSNVMSIAAAQASLQHILKDSDRFYGDLNTLGEQLMEGLRDAARKAGSDLLVQGLGSVFATSFTTQPRIHDFREHARYCDEEKYGRFVQAMLERGVRLAANGRWHLSSAHTKEDVERTVAAAHEALRAV